VTASETIDEAVARLQLWLTRSRPGLARLEYVSPRAMEAVFAALRPSIPVEIIDLPARVPSQQLISRMLAAVQPGPGPRLVCFTGLDRALPSPEHAEERKLALKAINLQRETFAETGVPQLWWMPPHLVSEFVRTAPDFDSWFTLKLQITEVPPGAPREQWVESIASPAEARQQARGLLERFENTVRAGEPWWAAWRELVRPGLDVLRSADLHAEADAEARRLGQLVEDLQGGPAQPATAEGFNDLAAVHQDLGDFQAARRSQEQALELAGSESDQAAYRNNLAIILRNLGEHQAAREQIELALASNLRQFGPDHPNVATTRNNLANILGNLGEHQAAREQIELALASALRQFGPDHPNVATTRNNLAQILAALGDPAGALRELDEALRIVRKTLPAQHPYIAKAEASRAAILGKMRQP